jgi:PAS domain S-box-containing protein
MHPVVPVETSDQLSFLFAILNGSQTPTLAFEPLRDEQGVICDFRANFANSAAEQLTGMTFADMRATSLLDVYPAARKSGLFNQLVSLVQSQQAFRSEFYVDYLDRWIDASISPLTGGFMATLVDVTLQKQAELERVHQSRTISDVLNASLNGIVIYEAIRERGPNQTLDVIVDYRFLMINQAGMRSLRLTESPIGKSMLSLFPVVQESGFFDQYVQVTETGNPLRFETPYQAKSVMGWYDVVVVKFNDGLIITFNDISESKRFTEHIEQQSKLLNGVMGATLDGILVYEAVRNQENEIVDYRTSLYNERALTLNKRTAEELTSRTLFTRSPYTQKEKERLQHLINTGESFTSQDFFPGIGWIETQCVKLNDGFLATFRDITDQKQADEQLKQQYDLLQGVLNTSLNGTIVYEAIRDENQCIQDFRFRLFNQTAREEILVRTGKDIDNSTLLTIYPDSHQTGLFMLYARVTDTGEAVRTEHFYPDVEAWYDVSLTKLEDGCVVTFINISASKRAFKRAEEQNTLLNGVMNVSPNSVIVFKAVRNRHNEVEDFQLVTLNEAAAQILGQPLDKLTGGTLLQLSGGSILSAFFEDYKRILKTREPLVKELQLPGSGKWYNFSVAPLGDGVVMNLSDLTDLKQSELAKQQQAELVNSVLDGAINSIVAYEAIRAPNSNQIVDFRIILANKAAEQYLQREGERLIGQRLLTLYPEERDMGLFARYIETVEQGKPFRTEAVYRENGTVNWLDISATKLSDGIVVTFTDVTLTKLAALELEQQAEFVSKLLDGSLNGIMSFDPVYERTSDEEKGPIIDLKILSANRAAEQYLNVNEYDLIGRNLLDLFPYKQDMGLFAMYKRVLETKRSERMEAYHYGPGVEFWLDVSATPRDSHGLVVSFMDITERRKAQQQTETLIEELRKSNANLEQFAYVASHDLQEPLRKITAFGDLLQSQHAAQLDESGADMIRRMQSAAARMQTLIKGLLTYSRVTNKRDAFKHVELSAVLANVLTDLETSLQDKKAIIDADDLPTVYGDALQLHQLFQNLLSNALKFTKPDVAPVIRIECSAGLGHELHERVPPALAKQYFSRIQVTDNGIGFEPRYGERIFQLFQRLHTRSDYSGTGIGLSIVQKVAENHNGLIFAEGRPGIGATFTILLPTSHL